ncbi:YbjN domain-containing protein [Streptomyces sp. NPDC056632]|uniref:YbjN domain-containing protein n=1 Tax=Streptomyces sp. NPDC056632 TaxID=3345884 RepID=UPI00368527D6
MANEDAIPDLETVKEILDQAELKHLVDDEGDLFAAWDGYRVYFVFQSMGEDGGQPFFSVRVFYDRRYGPAERPRLLDAADEWNRNALWPKVYTYAHEDESLQMIGEAHLILGPGMDPTQFAVSLISWVGAAAEFDQWLAARLGLEPKAADATDEEDGS